ncbi:MAG: hypothetical protein ACXVP5_02185 [Tumebacillaceae bacterium]
MKKTLTILSVATLLATLAPIVANATVTSKGTAVSTSKIQKVVTPFVISPAATTSAATYSTGTVFEIDGLQSVFTPDNNYYKAVWSSSPCVNGTKTGPGGTIYASVLADLRNTTNSASAQGTAAPVGSRVYGSIEMYDGTWYQAGSCLAQWGNG